MNGSKVESDFNNFSLKTCNLNVFFRYLLYTNPGEYAKSGNINAN